LEKEGLSQSEEVIGKNPLEGDLDSIWSIPKKRKKMYEESEAVLAVEEPQISNKPIEPVKTVVPEEIQKEAKTVVEEESIKRHAPEIEEVKPKIEAVIIPQVESANMPVGQTGSEVKEEALIVQPIEAIKPIEVVKPKEEEKGLEKTAEMVGFKIGNEFYGIDIIQVQEIIRMQEITMVPRTPPFIKGVVNLRGKVVPIISIRERFGIKEVEHTKDTRIVIVRIAVGLIGFIVDAMAEVIRLPERLIEPTPPTATNIESEYIRGVGKMDDKLLIILDLNMVLTKEKKEFLDFMERG
jgi:purine-binding chemotaxis protein CheW